MANDTINLLHEDFDYIIAPPMEKRVIFQRTVLSKNIRRKISKSRKRVKKSEKKQKDKMMAGVVLGLHRLFFATFICKCSLILYNKSVNVGGDV